MASRPQPNAVETIKAASNYLRGSLVDSLDDQASAAIAEADTQISKFHGVYQQDDRDRRAERKRQFLEPAYQFMIRARIPGGRCTPKQWLALDRLAVRYANASIRLTVRQSVQLHGVIKTDLKPTIAAINNKLLDTLAACGDVNRNVMCHANPAVSPIHAQVLELAGRVSAHLTPHTRAYHEIWLDTEKLRTTAEDVEPLYGPSYLPRKFKIAIAVPPDNDVDVFSQDLGFVAHTADDALVGFNVLAGGGMGMSHGVPETFPRLAEPVGFCSPEQVVGLAEAVVAIQRDFGDRNNRAHARLKYTLADRGMDWFREQLAQRLGFAPKPIRRFRFSHNGDAVGWRRGVDGRWHLTVFVENGRVVDHGTRRLRSAVAEIARIHTGDFFFTPNQNLIIAGVPGDTRGTYDALLVEYGVGNASSPLRQHSMACVGLPTCGLAMAESERHLPALVDRLDAMLAAHGLADAPISVRMTGCPNGCARPYIAEIGLVGKAPGRYKLFLGGGFSGDRLARLVLENADDETVLETLEPLIAAYAKQRRTAEHFADFLLRTKRLETPGSARDFHQARSPG